MTNTPQPNPWAGFTRDPRSREAAGLRASDADRDHAANILGESYADGRLRDPEYSERLESALRATYLQDFLPLVSDLALPSEIVVPEPPRPVVPWFQTPAFRMVGVSAGIIIGMGMLVLLLGGVSWWMIWPFMFFVLPQLIRQMQNVNQRPPGQGGTNELPNPNAGDDNR
ncbi:MAG: DUF1707 domain-containing protein [Propionibacteriaceae bacterium]|nr:DUF1707 domain-containing protein [Propionibacteriaceae bacterium]